MALPYKKAGHLKETLLQQHKIVTKQSREGLDTALPLSYSVISLADKSVHQILLIARES